MNKTKFSLILLFCLFELYACSFRLKSMFNHYQIVNLVWPVKIYKPSEVISYIASGAVDGSIKIWEFKTQIFV